MNDSEIPQEAPPPYSKNPEPKASHGIPTPARRSMEDEARPLPSGWVRQYDAASGHQFFVDSKADPPRSIWHHPYDDDDYLSTLTSEERERLQAEQAEFAKAHAAPAEPSNEPSAAGPSSRPPGASTAPEVQTSDGKQSFGRKMKDKLTGTTHEQREAYRRAREKQEAEAYAVHRRMREAMARAMQTGQPQFVATDREGHDIYVEPPQYGDRFYGGGRPTNYRGVNPYSQGPYADPNARFIRPANPYAGRPGYGGGLGLPLAGGLAGGLLLGGLLGGF